VNISIIIRLAWNQFQCLVQYSVHKRITVNKDKAKINKCLLLKWCYNNERPTGQKQPTVRWKDGGK